MHMFLLCNEQHEHTRMSYWPCSPLVACCSRHMCRSSTLERPEQKPLAVSTQAVQNARALPDSPMGVPGTQRALQQSCAPC